MASRRKILVVDDDPWIAKMLEFVVSDAGHVAIVCKDGTDALDKFAEVMPDLVLLDVVLPKLDGLKVCQHIKQSPIGRLTPVLVFSGIYRDSTEALKFGADAFLAKPFTPQQIGQQIKQMLPLLPEGPPADLAAPPLKPGAGETPLAQEPLPKALGRLFKSRSTGVLTLRSRVGIKYLFLEKGDVVQVRSPNTAAGVTTMLLARGPDTDEQLKLLQLTERERSIVNLIDGTKTLQEIVSIADLAGTDAVPVLYTLLCTGVVVASAPASTAAPKFQGPDSPNLTSTARALPGPFALAVMELWRNRETGVLRCVGPLDNRTVHVSRRAPVFAPRER